MEQNNQELIVYDNEEKQLSTIDKDAEDDFEEARATYKELIAMGKEGLASAKELAEDTEHPRAVEVFAGLINSISDVNSKLIELHNTKNKMKTFDKKSEQGQVTNNAIFVGNPAELQALLAGTK